MRRTPLSSPTLRSLAFRSLAGGFVLGAVALGAMAQPLAQAFAGHNSDAPVDYSADRIELQDRQDRVVLSGNVDINQGGMRLRAERITVAFSDVGTLKINRIDATGGVTVARGSETARGDVAVYDLGARLVTLVGNVRLNRGGDTLNGPRMVIDLSSGVASVNGRPSAPGSTDSANGNGGRVSGTFSVGNTN